MADKEPRRRKKRRESQKKEEVRSEDHNLFASLKQESRESDDQEVEEETVSHSHHSQPGNVAKLIFVILFSGLVVSMSFLFISLRSVDRTVDVFDVSHDDHNVEALHDEHLEEELHDNHDHDEEPGVSLDDLIPGLSSIFSLNDEHVKEVESTDIPAENKPEYDNDLPSYSIEPESSTDQGILEKYVEDTTSNSIEELSSSEIYPETSTPSYSEEETYSTFDYSEPEPSTPPVQTAEPINEAVNEESDDTDDEPSTEQNYVVDDVPDSIANDESDNIADDDPYSYSIYEKIDITNEYDFEIRDQLDDVDDILEKDSLNDDDLEDDDEDDQDDEGVDEEFDFWQF